MNWAIGRVGVSHGVESHGKEKRTVGEFQLSFYYPLQGYILSIGEKKIYQRGELLWMLKIWNTMELNALVF